MKRRHVILLLGLISAGAIAAFGDRSPTDPVVSTVTRERPKSAPRALPTDESSPPAAGRASAGSTSSGMTRDANRPRELTVLEIALRGEAPSPNASDAAASLFTSQTWVPPPAPAPPPPKPAAPPLPFSYLGKQQENGVWTVFLSREGDTLLVKAGDQVDSTYRVISIAPPTMTMQYVPLNEPQDLAIE